MRKQDTAPPHEPNAGPTEASVARRLTEAFHGKRCIEILPGPESVFNFEANLHVNVGASWRIRTGRRVAIARDDHQQMFGFATPVDAWAITRELLGERRVMQVAISPAGGDLSLTFDGDVHFDVFVDSCGYESWVINGEGLCVVGRGDGTVTVL